MTEREAAIPRPFGYIRDSNGEMRVFQHKPFTEVESICYSTAPVYSHAQMLEVWQASRKQALEEAHDVLGGWQSADTMRLRAGEMTAQEVRSVKAILGSCQFAIRSLSHPTGGKE